MASMSWLFTAESAPRATTQGEPINSFRDRLVQEQAERAHQRQHDLAEQKSAQNTPEMRIRTWEKVHGLKLPLDPEHPVLDVIAVGTRLTLEQVREEQSARASNAKGTK